jgi:hypothetical protein
MHVSSRAVLAASFLACGSCLLGSARPAAYAECADTGDVLATAGDWVLTREIRVGDYTVRVLVRQEEGLSRLEIDRHGRRLAEIESAHFYVGALPGETRGGFERDLTLPRPGTDVTGEGDPNLVVYEHSGGTHCCYRVHLFAVGEQFRRIDSIYGGDSAPRFLDVDDDGKLEVQAHDWTFEDWGPSFASTPYPLVLLEFQRGSYRPSERLMRTPAPDSAALTNEALRVRDDPTWQRFVRASPIWEPVLALLYGGHRRKAWEFFEQAWPPDVPGRDGYRAAFERELRKSPYWRQIATWPPSA